MNWKVFILLSIIHSSLFIPTCLGQEVLEVEPMESAVEIPDTIEAEEIPALVEVGDSVVVDSVEISQLTDSLIHNALENSGLGQEKERFVPDPIRSMWLGLVLPGGGQIYNRKYWKLPIIYGGFLGCLYALTWNGQMLHDYSQAYLDIMDSDPNTNSYQKMLPMGYDITGREERFKAIFRQKKDIYRKYRDMSIFSFFGVYLLSVLDAYVDGELSTFDISEDLSLQLEPTIIKTQSTDPFHSQGVPGIQCSLSF